GISFIYLYCLCTAPLVIFIGYIFSSSSNFTKYFLLLVSNGLLQEPSLLSPITLSFFSFSNSIKYSFLLKNNSPSNKELVYSGVTNLTRKYITIILLH